MKNLISITVFFFILTSSCTSYVPNSIELNATFPEGVESGKIENLVVNENYIHFISSKNGKEIAIISHQKLSENVVDRISESSYYSFYTRINPDGPVEVLSLSSEEILNVLLGDQLKPGKIPGLSLSYRSLPGGDIALFSDIDEWVIKQGVEKELYIDGVKYSATLLDMIKGDPQFDQPPLRIDLILVRQ